MRPAADDPASLTPEQRRRELAALLARGLLRLRDRRLMPAAPPVPTDPEKPMESVSNRLELPGEILLTGHTG